MCGITGFLDHNHSINEDDLQRASAAIRHRGGNGNGFFFEKKGHYTLGLANERLALIDLSEKAKQPLTSVCGNYTITFNGSIYNYAELRATLIKYGVTFATLTDTEVILECYKKWGIRSFEKLDGSYAFAIVDRKLSQLLVLRDELGSKPIYYFKNKGFYAFASEIRALLTFPNVPKYINKQALAPYFRHGYFNGEQTIYQDIFKQKKGILTTIDIHSGNSYDMPLFRQQVAIENTSAHTEEQILAKIEEYLTESTLKRNPADLPVGVLLSGGYDSATVAAILQKNQSKRIKTFTVGFKGEKLDEAPQALKIAAHLKTNHQEFYLDQKEAVQILESLPEIFDEPIGDSGAVSLAFIANQVKNEVKVLMGAEGGDELFGGYRTYAKAIKLDAFEQKKIPVLLKKFITSVAKVGLPQLNEILAADNLLGKYLETTACFTSAEIAKLLKEEPQLPDTKKDKSTSIKGLLIYDLHNYLPNNILFKTDRCFTHFGVENRDAILKTELISYLNTLDPQWFLKDGQQKYLLKQITNKYIPNALMKTPKRGFVIPLESWLKTIFRPLIEKYLSPESLNQHHLFDTTEVIKIKNTFYKNSTSYNAKKVWLLLQFQMWHERWMG